jgi:hypothetical protein
MMRGIDAKGHGQPPLFPDAVPECAVATAPGLDGPKPLRWAVPEHVRTGSSIPIDGWVSVFPAGLEGQRVRVLAERHDPRVVVTIPKSMLDWAGSDRARDDELVSVVLDAASAAGGHVMVDEAPGPLSNRPRNADGTVTLKAFPAGPGVAVTDLQAALLAAEAARSRPERWRGEVDLALTQGVISVAEAVRVRGIRDAIVARGGDARAAKGTATLADLDALNRIGLVRMGQEAPHGSPAAHADRPDRTSKPLAETLLRNVEMVRALVDAGRIKFIGPTLRDVLRNPTITGMMALKSTQAIAISRMIPAGVSEATLAWERNRPSCLEGDIIRIADPEWTDHGGVTEIGNEVLITIPAGIANCMEYYTRAAFIGGGIRLDLLDRWISAAAAMVGRDRGMDLREMSRGREPGKPMIVRFDASVGTIMGGASVPEAGGTNG